jgi:hypothetical protein
MGRGLNTPGLNDAMGGGGDMSNGMPATPPQPRNPFKGQGGMGGGLGMLGGVMRQPGGGGNPVAPFDQRKRQNGNSIMPMPGVNGGPPQPGLGYRQQQVPTNFPGYRNPQSPFPTSPGQAGNGGFSGGPNTGDLNSLPTDQIQPTPFNQGKMNQILQNANPVLLRYLMNMLGGMRQ